MMMTNTKNALSIAACASLLALGACATAHPPEAKSGRHTPHDESAVSPETIVEAETTHEAERVRASRKEVRSAPREWLGWGKREEDKFDHFARPVTNLHFHHPFMRNEVRAVAVHHRFPATSALGGGHLNMYVLQINAKLTDDLLFTAYKDGYVDLNPKAFPDTEGFADIAFGLKKVMYEDDDRIFTAGLGYETKSGAADVLEGQGKGVFDAFGSYATSFGDFNVILTAGFLIPTDSGADARQFHYHAHVDTPVADRVSALVELSGMHVMDDAHRNARLGAPLGFEGFDYTNLGAAGTDGNDVVTLGAGFRYDIDDGVSLGAAYELSVTSREDVFQDRFTLDLVLRF